MNRILLATMMVLALAPAAVRAGEIKVGEPLPEVAVTDKGWLVPEYTIEGGVMVHKPGTSITHRPFNSNELKGKIRTIYHLAARIGMDEVNKPFIDAIIAAKLPQKLPDSPYKTVTILNVGDALWGTAGLAHARMESSQKEFPHAEYVIDSTGAVLAAWGLEPKNSAVIIIDAEGKVLWWKQGKMTPEEIDEAMGIIKTGVTALGGVIPAETPSEAPAAAPAEAPATETAPAPAQ